MRPSRVILALLGVLSGMLLAVAVPGGFAAAGGPGRGPGYISLGPAAFQPSQSSFSYGIEERETLALVNTSGGLGRFYAPVSLPHGATVTHLTVSYEDENLNAGQDGRISLVAWAPLPPREERELGQVTTVNGDWIGSDPLDDRVANSAYHYAITADLYPGVYLYGVLVEYRYEASLPFAAR
jgi:hypothetical protein